MPDQFVLKCTHDSGSIVICKDKRDFDMKKAKEKIGAALKRKYYYKGREWAYLNIKPQIIAEEFLCDKEKPELPDYKLLCFNGKVKCSFTCSERETKELKVDFYDLNWDHMPFIRKYPASKNGIAKPARYEEMIALAEMLSKDIPFVRVDFYEVNGKLYFGELTFYPGGGTEKFDPEEWDLKLGRMLELPSSKTV